MNIWKVTDIFCLIFWKLVPVYISTTRIWECEFHSTLGREIWNPYSSSSEEEQSGSSTWRDQGKRCWSHTAMQRCRDHVLSFSGPSKNREEGVNWWDSPCFLVSLSPSLSFLFPAFLITCFFPLLKNIYHSRKLIKYRNVKS